MFRMIKNWFDFSPDVRDELTHTYQNYNVDMNLLSDKLVQFLKEQYDDVQIKKINSKISKILAKRTSLLLKYSSFSQIFIQLQNESENLHLKIILDKKPKHDLWTMTDPWQNGIYQDKVDFRDFLLNSIVKIISSLKNSKKRE